MRFCIFGVGAVGGLILAEMARAGVPAIGVARRETLAAIRARGIRVEGGEGEARPPVKVTVSDDTESLGPQDAVVVCMKAHRIPGALRHMAPLIGPRTVVVCAVNGIPWWYFHGLPGGAPNPHLDMVDPQGRIWQALGPERALGCVVYLGSSVPTPGVVSRTPHDLMVFGEPDGCMSDRLAAVTEGFKAAGFNGRSVPDIRAAVWHKLWGNAWANTVSILTGATLDRICADVRLRDSLRAMMTEIRDVARAYGVDVGDDIDARIAESATLGAFRSSTLQDWDRRRPVELDAILGAVTEMGRRAGVPTPAVDMVYGLARLAAEVAGCYRAPGEA